MNGASSGGEPLELVRYNAETAKFEVGQRALAVLRTIKGPIGVVAVCGRARQGKSFVLNQLLQVSGGFMVGPTTRPCTKGLWMWSDPQRCTARDGTDYHLVLLDTEGIDAYDQTAQYSTQIFSLAVLLSSLFVYNQMGGIDEAALDRLSLVTEMTKHIRVRASGKDADIADLAADLRDFTPSFLWLLRDFYLRLEDEHGRMVTPNDYLETALMPVAGVGAAVEAKNQIRSSIKSLFPDRDCCTLVRPAHDEQALVNLDLEDSAIRPEFREGVQALLALIFRKAQPKRLGAHCLTGAVLAGLTEAYVDAINNGAVPTIATAWQGVAEQECRRAADLALLRYTEVFDEGVAPEEKALDEEHARAMQCAQEVFRDTAVGDERIQKAHEHKFLDAALSHYGHVRARKLAEAANAVNEALLAASSAIAGTAALGGSSVADFHAQLAGFLEAYMQLPNSPTKWTKLVEFLKQTYPSVMNELLSRQEAAARHEVSRLQQGMDEAQRQAAQHSSRADQAEVRLSEASARAEELEVELAERCAQLAHVKVECEQQRSKAAALEVQLREVQLLSEKKLACSYAEAEARARAAALEHEQAISGLQARLSEERLRCGELGAELAEASGRIRGLEAQLAAAAAESSGWAKRYSEARAEQAAVSRHLDRAEAQVTALQIEKAALERERDRAQAEAAGLQAQLSDFAADIEGHMEEAEREKDRSLAASRCTSRKPSGYLEDTLQALQNSLVPVKQGS